MSHRKSKTGKPHELTALAVKGCLIAKDAAYNIGDLIRNRSAMAALAVKDCEKELDQIERQIDERLPQAITQVSEDKARELLACLKFIPTSNASETSSTTWPSASRCCSIWRGQILNTWQTWPWFCRKCWKKSMKVLQREIWSWQARCSAWIASLTNCGNPCFNVIWNGNATART